MTLSPAEIPVFPAGYAPLAADFDGWVQAPFAFLTSLIVFRAEQHTAQAITANTHTTVQFDTVLEDPYSGWNGTNWRWTAPFTGWYEITLTTQTSTATAMDQSCAVTISSGTRTQLAQARMAAFPSGTCMTYTAALVGTSDYVTGEIFTSVASNLNSTAGKYSAMEIIFVSE